MVLCGGRALPESTKIGDFGFFRSTGGPGDRGGRMKGYMAIMGVSSIKNDEDLDGQHPTDFCFALASGEKASP